MPRDRRLKDLLTSSGVFVDTPRNTFRPLIPTPAIDFSRPLLTQLAIDIPHFRPLIELNSRFEQLSNNVAQRINEIRRANNIQLSNLLSNVLPAQPQPRPRPQRLVVFDKPTPRPPSGKPRPSLDKLLPPQRPNTRPTRPVSVRPNNSPARPNKPSTNPTANPIFGTNPSTVGSIAGIGALLTGKL